MAVAPSDPLAPARLSTITDCFTRSPNLGVTSRAVMSDAPPAGKGTITVMLRSGYSAAWTEAADTAARAKSANVQPVGTLIGRLPTVGHRRVNLELRAPCTDALHPGTTKALVHQLSTSPDCASFHPPLAGRHRGRMAR